MTAVNGEDEGLPLGLGESRCAGRIRVLTCFVGQPEDPPGRDAVDGNGVLEPLFSLEQEALDAGTSSTVVAFYSHILASASGASLAHRHITAIATANGGVSWSRVPIGCPAGRPYVQFGALPGAQPGMGTGTVQPLLRSTNGGETFNVLKWPSGYINPQGFISGLAAPSGQYSPGSQGYRWYTLAPGATQWQRGRAIDAPISYRALLVVGSRVIWPTSDAGGSPVTTLPALRSAPLP